MKDFQVVLHHHPLPKDFYEHKKNFKNNLEKYSIGKYTFLKKLQQAPQTSLYKGYIKQPTSYVLIRVINLKCYFQNFKQRFPFQEGQIQQKLKSRLLMKVNSQNVIKLYECYQDQDYKIQILEYCEIEQNLLNRIKQIGQSPNLKFLDQNQRITIIKQVILALSHLFLERIFLRQLSPSKILIKNNQCKIMDIQFSSKYIIDEKFIEQNPKQLESLIKQQIYMIGLLYCQLTFGLEYSKSKEVKQMIFNNYNSNQINENMELLVNVSKIESDFLSKTLQPDINKRIGWCELIKHNIFRDNQTVNGDSLLKKVMKSTQQIIKVLQNSTCLSNTLINPQNNGFDNSKLNKQAQQALKNSQSQDNDNLITLLKTQKILKNIIIPIQTKEPLNKNSRQFIQMMYLIATRCWNDIKTIRKFITTVENTLIEKYFKQKIISLEKQINQIWYKYSNILTQKQNKMLQIGKDWIRKSLYAFKIDQSINEKNKFLVGLQVVDYQKDEQIKFTVEEYIKKMIVNMYDFDTEDSIKKYLAKYSEICGISFQDIKWNNFQHVLKMILSQK